MAEVEDCIKEALETIKNFVREVSGKESGDEEIARALKRYFVLKEINDSIQIERESL